MPRPAVRHLGVAASSLALVVTGGLLATTPAQSHGGDHDRHAKTELEADLNGRNEVDDAGVRGQGDPDGKGDAEVDVFRRASTGMVRLCWDIEVRNIGDATRAHIHAGAKGVNGPIVVAFFETGQPQAFEACTVVDRDLAREIRSHPGDYYVNVHNTEFPAGAVRGQLERD